MIKELKMSEEITKHDSNGNVIYFKDSNVKLVKRTSTIIEVFNNN